MGSSRREALVRRAGIVGTLTAVAVACVAAGPTGHPVSGVAPSGGTSSGSTPSEKLGSAPADAASTTAGAPAEPVSSPERCAASALARLTPVQRAGQVLIVGVPVNDTRSAVAVVRAVRPGGVFLAGRSKRTLAEVGRQVRAVQGASGPTLPLHVAVDQEGGLVQTLSGPGIGRIPRAVEQGRWDDATLTARTTRWAAALHTAGVTINFAPVADTVPSNGYRNPPIGAVGRHYGVRPGEVAADVATVTRAIQDAGVLATLKHFPGLGRVRANTDTSNRAVDPVAVAGDSYLQPFAAGVQAGAGAVMMSSARYPRLDAQHPAMFSPRIVGMLRDDLGFAGLIVSDDLGAAAAVRQVPVGRRAVAFVAAGGDMVLTVRPKDARPMVAALGQAAAASPGFRQRLDDAVHHVLMSKYRAGLLRCTA